MPFPPAVPAVFLPTPSARRATASPLPRRSRRPDFYPRPPRGGRPQQDRRPAIRHIISTHALREEGDQFVGIRFLRLFNFYPRPPRGGRHTHALSNTRALSFLPTPSARRATYLLPVTILYQIQFLPTPSARRATKLSQTDIFVIGEFLPTPSARRATVLFVRAKRKGRNFYPRPPRGGRPQLSEDEWDVLEFLPTPSARRATLVSTRPFCEKSISTHALREEGDISSLSSALMPFCISTHALREEGDLSQNAIANVENGFLPTPSARRATDAKGLMVQ